MKQEHQKKGKLYDMYGNYVRVPYTWYSLCRKYEIPKEIATLKTKGNTIELNPMEINVLAYLAGYELDPDLECYPGNNLLASIFQVGVSTIEKYLKELRWTGLIKSFEQKSNATYTERRYIHVQFDMIDAVLASESNPYKCMAPYKHMGTIDDVDPHEHMDDAIQTDGLTHTNELADPYMLATYNKELENIKKYNKYTTEEKIKVQTEQMLSKENLLIKDSSDQPITGKYVDRLRKADGSLSDYMTTNFIINTDRFTDACSVLVHEYELDINHVAEWFSKEFGYKFDRKALDRISKFVSKREDVVTHVESDDLPFN